MLGAIDKNFDNVILHKTKGREAGEAHAKPAEPVQFSTEKPDVKKSDSESVRNTLLQSSMESAKELSLDEEKTALFALQMFALGGEPNIGKYMQKAREYAQEKGIDVYEVLRPDGQFYNEFVNFLQNNEPDFDTLETIQHETTG